MSETTGWGERRESMIPLSTDILISDEEMKSARILLVDDNEDNIALLEALLAAEGYSSVLGITDPRKGVALYQSYQPDLVVLDINMPHMDGFAVMEKLMEIEKGAYPPILALTAQKNPETRLRALQSGARDFLTKPFDRAETLTRIRNMLETRLLHNRMRDQNALLETKVRARTAELEDTRKEIIRRLGRAAEYKDNETGNHIIRMSKICHALALAAGMSEREADILLNASPMHDIGKIGIPDGILLKPGKLDPDEWKIMMTHTTIGVDLLSGHDSRLMHLARAIAQTHHEKWDGSGYPQGIAGNAIPRVGRIAALADVFDALTSVRPYKKAWSVEEAVAEISKGRGSHFDPELVDVFLTILPEVNRIRAQYEDSAQ